MTAANNNLTVLSELFYERETEYFGTTPYALLDRIGSMIVDCYFDALSQLHSAKLPANCPFLSETQIAAALTQWTLLVEASIDKNFELFETYIMKNILALPADFPIDKFLALEETPDFIIASPADLSDLQDRMSSVMRRLKQANNKNRKLKGELELLTRQEDALDHLEGHLTCIKEKLAEQKIESFERSMSAFVGDLTSLQSIVKATLKAGSDYLFAKYDAELIEASNSAENQQQASTSSDHPSNKLQSDAYRRILSEMAGLSSAAQTAEQIEARRRENALELTEKSKIATISDFESFRALMQRIPKQRVEGDVF